MIKTLLLFGLTFAIHGMNPYPFSSSSSSTSSSSTTTDEYKSESQVKTFLNETDIWTHFSLFQSWYDKRYSTFVEMEQRFNIFKENLNKIVNHNINKKSTFKMAINEFADLTADEFKRKYINGGFKNYKSTSSTSSTGSQQQSTKKSTKQTTKQSSQNFTSCSIFTGTKRLIPFHFDWRDNNAVTPVKDQGQCGSCWSFSTTGALEGAWAIKTGHLVSFSEQQLVECSSSYGNQGCSGGLMDNGFKYAIDNGMCTEETYPYTHTDTNKCHSCQVVARFSGCADVEANNQLVLREAVATGPVSIAIEADTEYFQFYSSGVLTETKCGTNLDHGVLIVGYGTENGIKYWLVKNSWGETWGDEGYIKIARSESTNDPGVCGIAMSASFPIV